MLDTIKRFFENNLLPDDDAQGPSSADKTTLAAAALLVEMARIDDEVLDIEQDALLRIVQDQFGLPAEHARQLLELANQEISDASGYYQFTALINEEYSPVQKLAVLENLWQVAYADNEISAHERHLMRKLADLLHIPHGDHMLAMERAKRQAGKPGSE